MAEEDRIRDHEVEAQRCDWPDMDDELWAEIKHEIVGLSVWKEDVYPLLDAQSRRWWTIHKMIDFW